MTLFTEISTTTSYSLPPISYLSIQLAILAAKTHRNKHIYMHTEAEPCRALQSRISSWKGERTFAYGQSNVISYTDAAKPRACQQAIQSSSLPLGDEGLLRCYCKKENASEVSTLWRQSFTKLQVSSGGFRLHSQIGADGTWVFIYWEAGEDIR